jgi:hypothetical protein
VSHISLMGGGEASRSFDGNLSPDLGMLANRKQDVTDIASILVPASLVRGARSQLVILVGGEAQP